MAACPACDAVVNLAGQHILNIKRRWNDSYRNEVIKLAGRHDAKTGPGVINESRDPPEVFVSVAGKCFYGTRELNAAEAHPELDEDSKPMGLDFPAELVGQWEAAADGVDAEPYPPCEAANRRRARQGRPQVAPWPLVAGRTSAGLSTDHSVAVLPGTWLRHRQWLANAALGACRRHGGHPAPCDR